MPNIQAVQIVEPTDDHSFILKIDDLEKILNTDEIRDRYIVVVSVAGALRQGKSFLLNFFLQYLNAQYKRYNVSEFLKVDMSKGFSWRGGSKPDTTGILIWPEVFTYDYKNGEKVAIILMDTQGSFDNESSIRDCSIIFALNAMLSSVLCYNLMRNIREDDLQYLQLFTEYGKMFVDQSQEKAFQELVIIVRDWSFPYEHDFGWNGGQEVVNDRLAKTAKQTGDMRTLRDQIKCSFEHIRGFLMPYPGETVAGDPNFNGKLKDIAVKFKDQLMELVPKILAPDNLIVKKINGQKIRAKDFIQYFKSYMTVFNKKKMPELKTILEATAESYNLIAHLDAKSNYETLMKDEVNKKTSYFQEQPLKILHNLNKSVCIKQFSDKPKLGNASITNKYLEKLQHEIELAFENVKMLNLKKKQKYIQELEKKIAEIEHEATLYYQKEFEILLVGSSLSDTSLKDSHSRIKNETFAKVKPKFGQMDAEYSEKCLKNIEKELDQSFVQIKLKNTEKKNDELKKQKEKEEEEFNARIAALKKQQEAARSLCSPSYFDFPSPQYSSGYDSSFSCYSPARTYQRSPSLSYSNFSSASSSTQRRVNYTSSENATLPSLYNAYGRDWNAIADAFNSSSSNSTPRTAKQIQSKYYRMRRNGDVD